jgi:L-iditol 2-dehydrogenase
LSSNIADVETLITDRYPLRETKQALGQARTNKSESLKVIVYPNE